MKIKSVLNVGEEDETRNVQQNNDDGMIRIMQATVFPLKLQK